MMLATNIEFVCHSLCLSFDCLFAVYNILPNDLKCIAKLTPVRPFSLILNKNCCSKFMSRIVIVLLPEY